MTKMYLKFFFFKFSDAIQRKKMTEDLGKLWNFIFWMYFSTKIFGLVSLGLNNFFFILMKWWIFFSILHEITFILQDFPLSWIFTLFLLKLKFFRWNSTKRIFLKYDTNTYFNEKNTYFWLPCYINDEFLKT